MADAVDLSAVASEATRNPGLWWVVSPCDTSTMWSNHTTAWGKTQLSRSIGDAAAVAAEQKTGKSPAHVALREVTLVVRPSHGLVPRARGGDLLAVESGHHPARRAFSEPLYPWRPGASGRRRLSPVQRCCSPDPLYVSLIR